MKKLLTFLFISLLFSISAQSKLRQEKNGDRAFFRFAFLDAIDSYTRTKTLTLEGQNNLAEAYRNVGDFKMAESIYANLVADSVNCKPSSYFYFSQVLKNNGKYEEAEKVLQVFSALQPNDRRSLSFKMNKQNLSSYLTPREDVTVTHLAINSEAQDFGATYFQEKIVFVSSNSKPYFVQPTYNWNDKPFLNLYIAEIENGELVHPKLFAETTRSRLHDGPASFNATGQQMAFTTNSFAKKNKSKRVMLRIETSYLSGNKWSKPEAFLPELSGFSTGHPALSSDGKTMYFASDQPGGFGGVDVYICRKNNDGSWSIPENLGDVINTEGDDMFPFFDETNQRLYFASDGHFGIGGLDVFVSQLAMGKWGKVTNLGAPINSNFDDFGWSMHPSTKKGFFSSNRSGGKGSDDLYSFELTQDSVQHVSLDATDTISKTEPPIFTISLDTATRDLEESRIVQLQSIYFDFDAFAIRPDAARELDKIAAILNKHPDMQLELASFTDDRGSAEYNDLLSEYRAIESCNYLQLRISNPKRVSGKGYGKRKVVYVTGEANSSVGLPISEQHQLNRRTEFKVKW